MQFYHQKGGFLLQESARERIDASFLLLIPTLPQDKWHLHLPILPVQLSSLS